MKTWWCPVEISLFPTPFVMRKLHQGRPVLTLERVGPASTDCSINMRPEGESEMLTSIFAWDDDSEWEEETELLEDEDDEEVEEEDDDDFPDDDYEDDDDCQESDI